AQPDIEWFLRGLHVLRVLAIDVFDTVDDLNVPLLRLFRKRGFARYEKKEGKHNDQCTRTLPGPGSNSGHSACKGQLQPLFMRPSDGNKRAKTSARRFRCYYSRFGAPCLVGPCSLEALTPSYQIPSRRSAVHGAVHGRWVSGRVCILPNR